MTRIKQANGLTDKDEILGATDDNRVKSKVMVVSDQIEKNNPKELLRVLLDEAMHALDSTIENSVVEEKAKDLSDFLWRCGYRRIKASDGDKS